MKRGAQRLEIPRRCPAPGIVEKLIGHDQPARAPDHGQLGLENGLISVAPAGCVLPGEIGQHLEVTGRVIGA